MATERFQVRYDGSPDLNALKGRLQRGECPLIEIVDGGKVVAASYAAIGDSARLDAQLELIAARVDALQARAAAGVECPLPAAPSRTPAVFSPLRELTRSARRRAGKMLAPFRRGVARRHWNLALRRDEGPPRLDRFDLDDYAPLPVDPATFYADPFLLERGGRHYLFAEACNLLPFAFALLLVAGAIAARRKSG